MNNKPHFLQLKPRLSSLNHNFLHYIIISITSPTNKSDSQNQYNLNLLHILRICYTLLNRKITCNRFSNTGKLTRSASFSDTKLINSTFFPNFVTCTISQTMIHLLSYQKLSLNHCLNIVTYFCFSTYRVDQYGF